MEESCQGKSMDACVASILCSKTYWIILCEAGQQGQRSEVQRKALWSGNKNAAVEEEKKEGRWDKGKEVTWGRVEERQQAEGTYELIQNTKIKKGGNRTNKTKAEE